MLGTGWARWALQPPSVPGSHVLATWLAFSAPREPLALEVCRPALPYGEGNLESAAQSYLFAAQLLSMSRAFPFSPLPPPRVPISRLSSQSELPALSRPQHLPPPPLHLHSPGCGALLGRDGESERAVAGRGRLWPIPLGLLRMEDAGPGLGISTDWRRGVRAGPETARGPHTQLADGPLATPPVLPPSHADGSGNGQGC